MVIFRWAERRGRTLGASANPAISRSGAKRPLDRQLVFVPSPWLTKFATEAVALTPLSERPIAADENALFIRVKQAPSRLMARRV
jgi:hypothetical protein